MPTFDYQCQKCNAVEEVLFHRIGEALQEIVCKKCGGKAPRCFARPHVGIGGEIPGYEKETQGQLTIQKAIDGRQKWV